MIIATVKETFPGERRVALDPSVLPKLTKAGHEVWLEAGAGLAAGFADAAFADRGARIVPGREDVLDGADILVQVRGLGANPEAGRDDLDHYRPGQVVVAFQEPLTAIKEISELARTGVIAFGMELIPRISRAQSMDALSSMATIAGYKGVLLAANELPKMFPLMMTAAGTVTPAKVLVIGAGVAGLQAIASARRLGAVVEAYDVRPAVKEEIQSLGAKFVELELQAEDAQDAGGYAKEQSESFLRRQREGLTKVLETCDVVIATAAVPGKRAPVLLTAEMVAHMPAGSVVVDLAAERGGNCELTRPGETVVERGVTVVGPLNLAATIPYHASHMYARNLAAFLRHLTPKGELQLNLDDPITRETLLTRDGEVVHSKVRELLGLAPPPAGGE
jgi:NAD(P) transhydrogenase subunit alpha